MEVTPATSADIPRLVELLGLLFAQETEFSPDAEKQDAGLRAILADPAVGTLLVLRDGAQVVGMVNLLYSVSTALGARVALLEDMIIDPAHRKQGGGTQLLQAAIVHATRAGCRRITLLTDGSNVLAQVFYRKMGFTPSPMTPFRLALPLGE